MGTYIDNGLYIWFIDLLFHHVVEDKGRHEGDGKGTWTLTEELAQLLIFHANHILSVNFSQVVINQHTIPRII